MWRRWTDALAFFDLELPRRRVRERILPSFALPAFPRPTATALSRPSGPCPAFLLAPTQRDFYLADPLAAHSPTRGECSLFLTAGEGAFPRER